MLPPMPAKSAPGHPVRVCIEATGKPLRKMMSWLNAPVTDEESA